MSARSATLASLALFALLAGCGSSSPSDTSNGAASNNGGAAPGGATSGAGGSTAASSGGGGGPVAGSASVGVAGGAASGGSANGGSTNGAAGSASGGAAGTQPAMGGGSSGGASGGAGEAGGGAGAVGGSAGSSAGTPGVRIVGRTAPGTNGAIRFSWPGVSIHARFTGTQVSLNLNDASNQNRFSVVVDGGTPKTVTTAPGQTTLALASGLASGAHDLLI